MEVSSKGKLTAWESAGGVLLLLGSVILHFNYGNTSGIGLWQHLTFLGCLALLFTIVEYLAAGKSIDGFLYTKAIALLMGLFILLCVFLCFAKCGNRLIPAVAGTAAALALTGWWSIKKAGHASKNNAAGVTLWIILTACFLWFCAYPVSFSITGSTLGQRLLLWEIWGAVWVILAGSVMHYFYEWTHSRTVALFFACNESTQEHLKLLLVPSLMFTIVEYFFIGSAFPGFFFTKAMATLLGIFAVAVSFSAYQSMLGFNFLVANIGTFVIGSAVICWFSVAQMAEAPLGNAAGLIVWALTFVYFAWFTLHPVQAGMFLDPVDHFYGIPKPKQKKEEIA